jgi:predicted signal transduction protein with EAL and GGDEF domain
VNAAARWGKQAQAPNQQGDGGASIRLANQLNFACCIQGIETGEAAIKLASLGADEIQGYWPGKPQFVRESGLLFKCAL